MYKYLFTIPLREAVFAQKGIKPAVLEKSALENGVPYLDISVLETGIIKEYTYRELGNLSTDNEILVVWDGSRSGLVFLGKSGVVGSTLMALTPIECHQEFIYYFLRSQFDFLNGNTTGTSIPHVDSEIFFSLDMPYVPLPQQKLIVNDIKKRIGNNLNILKKQSDAINDELSKISLNYKPHEDVTQSILNFRHSILQNAVSGRLTENYAGTPSTPTEKTLTYFPVNNQIKSWTTKSGWQFVKLRDVIQSFDYGTSNRSSDNGLIPVLRMGNIQENKVDWSNLKYSSITKEIDKYKLSAGDVLFNRTNSPELVGKTAFFDGSRQAIFAGYIIRLVASELIDPHFLTYCLNSNYARDFYTMVMIGSANQANISATRLGEFLIPLPSLNEQKEIVKKVNLLTNISENLKKQYLITIEYFIKLEKSIIQNAFEVNQGEINNDSPERNTIINGMRARKSEIESEKKKMQKINSKTRNTMKKAAASSSSLEIEDVLNSIKEPVPADIVWKESKYKGDIDGFYEALKEKIGQTIQWELTEKDQAVPQSMISLKH